MIEPSKLKESICKTFCAEVSVTPLPIGLGISTVFQDSSGDRLSCYLIETADGYRLVDDGEYLANLIASDIDIETGARAKLLENVLAAGPAHWDRETYQIKSDVFSSNNISKVLPNFLSVLIRARDLGHWTKDAVRSTFREDAVDAINKRFSAVAVIEENVAVDPMFKDFPIHVLIRPKNKGKAAAVYLANNNDALNEALLLHQEAMVMKRQDFSVIALIEDYELKTIGRRQLQRAVNRLSAVPVFRGDEDAAMAAIARQIDVILPNTYLN